EPVHLAQAEVEEDEVWRRRAQRVPRRRVRGRHLAGVAAPAQEAPERARVDLLVVDDQDGRHARVPPSATGRLISTAVPAPSLLVTVMAPSCAVTIFWASASPSPVPDFLPVAKSVRSEERRVG